MAEATVALPSGTVQYLDSGGKGVPIVLLHPFNNRLWKNQFPAFTNAGYRVIAVDTRNRDGLAAPSGAPTSVAAMARLDELVARLALPKFHLIGTGGGSPLAMEYASVHPDKVRTVIPTNSLGGLRDTAINALELSLRPSPFTDLPRDFRELSGSYRASNPEGAKEWLAMDQEGRAAVPSSPPVPGPAPAPTPPDPNVLTLARLDALEVPTLMMVGDADLYTPPSVMRIFVSHLKHGAGVVIDESGHQSYWENPVSFNHEVLSFIRRY